MVPIRELKTYSILLADDMTLVREGLAAICDAQPQYRVVGQCGEGSVALRLIETHRPDIAVLDLNLPDLFTLEIVRKVREANLPTRIVVLSTRKDRKTVVEALRAGVNAFLLKSGPSSQLLQAFDQVWTAESTSRLRSNLTRSSVPDARPTRKTHSIRSAPASTRSFRS